MLGRDIRCTVLCTLTQFHQYLNTIYFSWSQLSNQSSALGTWGSSSRESLAPVWGDKHSFSTYIRQDDIIIFRRSLFFLVEFKGLPAFQSVYFSPLTVKGAWTTSWVSGGCTTWNFIVPCEPSPLCLPPELCDWPATATEGSSGENSPRMHKPFTEKVLHHHGEVYLYLPKWFFFSCNFQHWFPDNLSAVISSYENKFQEKSCL